MYTPANSTILLYIQWGLRGYSLDGLVNLMHIWKLQISLLIRGTIKTCTGEVLTCKIISFKVYAFPLAIYYRYHVNKCV